MNGTITKASFLLAAVALCCALPVAVNAACYEMKAETTNTGEHGCSADEFGQPNPAKESDVLKDLINHRGAIGANLAALEKIRAQLDIDIKKERHNFDVYDAAVKKLGGE